MTQKPHEHNDPKHEQRDPKQQQGHGLQDQQQGHGLHDQKQQREQALREREQHGDEQLGKQHARNAQAQNAPEGYTEPSEIDAAVKAEYENVDQPGKDPRNAPNPDSTMFKTVRDLEDITGNPGHRNINPNAPATSINREMPDARENPPSINEPPDVRQAPRAAPDPHGMPHSINEPPGSQVIPPGAGQGSNNQETPVIESLDPDEADAGDAEDITMHVRGSGFTAQSVIVFNGHDEPTVFVDEGDITTIVKPSLFTVPAVCPVLVKNGDKQSEADEFEFLDAEESPASRTTKRTKPKKAKQQPHHRR